MRAVDQQRTESLQDFEVQLMEREQNVAGGEKSEKFTSILLNRKPGVGEARTIILLIFIIQGMVQSYQNAIILDLQERGASYDDQAFFMLSQYPYIFKIIQAPFIDTYYIKWFGKCKTYIVSIFLLFSILLFWLAPHQDGFIQPSNIKILTFIWMGINIVIILSQIAGEMWIVKIFSDAHKGSGTILVDIGM